MPKKSGKHLVEAILKRYPNGLDRNQIQNYLLKEYNVNYNTRTIADTYCEQLINENLIITIKNKQKIIYIHRDAEKEKVKDFLYNPFMKTDSITDIMIARFVCQKFLKQKVEELEQNNMTFPGYNYSFFLEIIQNIVNSIDDFNFFFNKEYRDDKVFKKAHLKTGFADYSEFLIKWLEELSRLIRLKRPQEILQKESHKQKLKKIIKFFSILDADLRFIQMTPAFSEDIEISVKNKIKLSKIIFSQIVKRFFLQREIYEQMDCPEDLSFDLNISYKTNTLLTNLKFDDFNDIKEIIKEIFGIKKIKEKLKKSLLSEGYSEKDIGAIERNRILKEKIKNRIKRDIINTLNQYYFEKEKELEDFFHSFRKLFGRYDLIVLLNKFNENVRVPYFGFNDKIAIKSIVEDVFIIDIPIDEMLSEIEMVSDYAKWRINNEIENRKKIIEKAFINTKNAFNGEIKKKMIEKLGILLGEFKNKIKFYYAKKESNRKRIYR
jgi:hypothetical protein